MEIVKLNFIVLLADYIYIAGGGQVLSKSPILKSTKYAQEHRFGRSLI